MNLLLRRSILLNCCWYTFCWLFLFPLGLFGIGACFFRFSSGGSSRIASSPLSLGFTNILPELLDRTLFHLLLLGRNSLVGGYEYFGSISLEIFGLTEARLSIIAGCTSIIV